MHGMSKTPEYRAWKAMKRRCYNKNTLDYQYYGFLGVTVCGEWLHDFLAFYQYVGQRPTPTHSIDRYPNKNGNYEPGNVRWATVKEQANNQRDNIRITIGEETHTAAEWAELKGLKKSTLSARIVSGMDPVKAVLTPLQLAGTPAIFMTIDGVTNSLAGWARVSGVPRDAIRYRLLKGWDQQEAIFSPLVGGKFLSRVSTKGVSAAPVSAVGKQNDEW